MPDVGGTLPGGDIYRRVKPDLREGRPHHPFGVDGFLAARKAQDNRPAGEVMPTTGKGISVARQSPGPCAAPRRA